MTVTDALCVPFPSDSPGISLRSRPDVEHSSVEEAKFAEFTFFGEHGEAIVGKDAQYLSAYTAVQPGNIPSEIAALVGRKYTVIVTPSAKSLHADYYHFQVKRVEPLREVAAVALLPVGVPPTAQGSTLCSSSGTTALGTQQSGLDATPPPVDSSSRKDQSPPSTVEKEICGAGTSLEKNQNVKGDPLSQSMSNKRQAAKELFPAKDQKGQKTE